MSSSLTLGTPILPSLILRLRNTPPTDPRPSSARITPKRGQYFLTLLPTQLQPLVISLRIKLLVRLMASRVYSHIGPLPPYDPMQSIPDVARERTFHSLDAILHFDQMNVKSGDSMFSLWCVIYFTLLVCICKLFIFGVLSGHGFPCLTQAYMTMLPLTTGRNYVLSHSAPNLGKLHCSSRQESRS